MAHWLLGRQKYVDLSSDNENYTVLMNILFIPQAVFTKANSIVIHVMGCSNIAIIAIWQMET
ncbi:hypothetical protein EYS14_16945 [Alteromonadaceae bacterium M269]|nr:hypothetical protein EYS14_16945 [Alteromonadaceae bacterium M269]